MTISEIGKQRKHFKDAFSLIELIVTMMIVGVCLGMMLRSAVHLAYVDKRVREKKTLLNLGDQLWFSLMDKERWPVSPDLIYEIREDHQLPPEQRDHYRPVNMVLYPREGEAAQIHYASGYIQFP